MVVTDGTDELGRIAVRALGDDGFVIVETNDGAEALRMLDARDAATLVAAVNLGAGDGLGVPAAAAADDAEVPVIVVARAASLEEPGIRWLLLDDPLSAQDLRAAVADGSRRGPGPRSPAPPPS